MWVPATQYQTKFKTLAAAGQAPDLVECGDVWIAYMLPFMYDVTDLVERDREEIHLDDFLSRSAFKACQHEGRYYFLAAGMNVSLLYYNRRCSNAPAWPIRPTSGRGTIIWPPERGSWSCRTPAVAGSGAAMWKPAGGANG
jgi:maltose-binding protein MalE